MAFLRNLKYLFCALQYTVGAVGKVSWSFIKVLDSKLETSNPLDGPPTGERTPLLIPVEQIKSCLFQEPLICSDVSLIWYAARKKCRLLGKCIAYWFLYHPDLINIEMTFPAILCPTLQLPKTIGSRFLNAMWY